MQEKNRLAQEALTQKLRTFVHQERPDRYKCCIDECWKAFQAEKFWMKHVRLKHTECLDYLKAKVGHKRYAG